MEFTLDKQLAKDCLPIGDLKLCRLLLMNDSQFPWFILVPRRSALREIFELSREDQVSYLIESNLVARLLVDIFAAEKLNIAALGNVVSQLHIHHIARYESDPCWPRPSWGQLPMKTYELSEVEGIIEKVKQYFGHRLKNIPGF